MVRNMALVAALGLGSVFLSAGQARAALPPGTACPDVYLDGTRPAVLKPAVASRSVEICRPGFSDIYFAGTLGPVAASEHLTRAELELATDRRRNGEFHPDRSLPGLGMPMATVRDFSARGTCLDKGHMANDRDKGRAEDAEQTYNLSNIVPQDADNNERLWEGIESEVRKMVMASGEAYVVTIPIYDGQTVTLLNNRIPVPTRLAKAFWIPSKNLVGAYLTLNQAGDAYWSITMDELKAISSIDPFPSLPAAYRNVRADLPKPRGHFPSNRELEGSCKPLPMPAPPAPPY